MGMGGVDHPPTKGDHPPTGQPRGGQQTQSTSCSRPDGRVMVVGDRHEGQKKARIEYFQTKAVAMECGGRVLTGIADLPGRGEASG